MKAILLSVRPEHALNILNGTKTRELRKTIPHGFVGWVYVYVTKGGKLDLVDQRHICVGEVKKENTYALLVKPKVIRTLKGTIPFRFWFDEYIAYKYYADDNTYFAKRPEDFGYGAEEVLKRLCLTRDEFKDYGKGKDLYAWHIKRLEVFEKPMTVQDFGLTRAPQSYQKVIAPEGKE